MKIWANTIVHNEENFIWFAIMSIIDYVDKVLIYDTGSTDNTVKIIKEIIKIKGDKIDFKEAGKVDKYNFTKQRQRMLEESKCDWILILDGDEIWWNKSIKTLTDKIKEKGKELDGIVVPMVVPVGDIYHMQDEEAGQYKLLERNGHLSLRAINKSIPGLHVDWPYGKESFFDENKRLIQERKKIIFLEAPYLHVTHLKRSNKKRKIDKFKYELGTKVFSNFKFPESLYHIHPDTIAHPWNKLTGISLIKAALLTPLRKIKRTIYG